MSRCTDSGEPKAGTKPRRLSEIAIAACLLMTAAPCRGGDPFVADACSRAIDAEQILETATSEARSYGYETKTMFAEIDGPMHWETMDTLRRNSAVPIPSEVEHWKKELAGRCIWFIFFGCEPGHTTRDGGFEGCLDYPLTLWILVDGTSGKILHTARYTGKEGRIRLDE